MLWHIKQILIALDQLLNTICGGWADETISSALHRRRLRGKPFWADSLDMLAACFGDHNHCAEAYESERIGRQLPPEFRRQ